MTSTQTSQIKVNKGFVIAFISAMVLSFTGILIRMISENYQLPALIIAFWRDIFVVICALPLILILRPKILAISRKDLPFLLLFGVVLAFFNILWTLAVTLSGAAVATVLVYSSAGFTAVLGYFFLKEPLGWQKIIAVILCLAGCVFVSGATQPGAWQNNPLGIITGLFSGLLYAVYSLMGRRATQKALNPWTTLFYSFLFAAAILLAINILPLDFLPASANNSQEMLMLGSEWRGWLLLILLAAGPTLVGFGLYNTSLGLLHSSTANLILTSEPVMTTIAAYFLLGERLSSQELFGSALILLALILLRIMTMRQARKSR
jgi:drug/metabolite transporter (DMT)-like permease